MALKVTAKIDDKLAEMYENETTTNVIESASFVDKSDLILQHMNFIALNNKSFLNLK